jgi:hypothetical protein
MVYCFHKGDNTIRDFLEALRRSLTMTRRTNVWHIPLLAAVLLAAAVLLTCDEKTTAPEEGLNVTNENPHCGLVAGFVKDASGENLSTATVSIFPASPSRAQNATGTMNLSGFMNYPNPFTSDTHITYRLDAPSSQSVNIAVYDLHHQLLRALHDAPTAQGSHKVHFDGCDSQDSTLANGLYPCDLVVTYPGGRDSVRIILSKGVNIDSEGGLQSYTTSSSSDGKYVIADIPLHMMLQATNILAPRDTIHYPENWPYVTAGWTLTDRFVVSASKVGYGTAIDTVTLIAGQVVRTDFTLR